MIANMPVNVALFSFIHLHPLDEMGLKGQREPGANHLLNKL